MTVKLTKPQAELLHELIDGYINPVPYSFVTLTGIGERVCRGLVDKGMLSYTDWYSTFEISAQGWQVTAEGWQYAAEHWGFQWKDEA